MLDRHYPGDSVDLVWQDRSGQQRTAKVTLAARTGRLPHGRPSAPPVSDGARRRRPRKIGRMIAPRPSVATTAAAPPSRRTSLVLKPPAAGLLARQLQLVVARQRPLARFVHARELLGLVDLELSFARSRFASIGPRPASRRREALSARPTFGVVAHVDDPLDHERPYVAFAVLDLNGNVVVLHHRRRRRRRLPRRRVDNRHPTCCPPPRCWVCPQR